MISVEPYGADRAGEWNAFVTASKNGTFLFDRGYMDYHRDRFTDASLMVRRDGALVALLPASRHETSVVSHGGLTYGGVVSGDGMGTALMLEVFAAIIDHLRAAGIRELIYKTIPSIYHRLPAEEDRYALFRAGAQLARRDVLSVVDTQNPGPVSERRRRGARRAAKAGLIVAEDGAWDRFWPVLEDVLRARHDVAPVHALGEITALAAAFPDGIRLFTVRDGAAVVAGTVLFVTGPAVHAQYIAANEAGREAGALDLLFLDLIARFGGHRYFDFGISNEDDGRVLNEGLAAFKEGFGARAIAHDFYRLAIS